jgi:hypothetical protein
LLRILSGLYYPVELGALVSVRRKKDIVASLKGIFAIVATLIAFIVFLMLLVVIERLVFGL